MFDLLVYDPRRTEKLMRLLNIPLSGKVIEGGVLPTSELLVLMRHGRRFSLHLLGASSLMPVVTLEEGLNDHEAALTLPLTARKLMGKRAIKLRFGTRADFRETVRSLRTKEVDEDVAVQVEQH